MSLSEDRVKHLVLPGYEKASCPVVLGESISAFLTRSEWKFNLPTICVFNGVPVLREDWQTTTISGRDNVVFYSKPFGGGGSTGDKSKMVLGLVALVALTAFAPWAAGSVFAAGSFGFYAASTAIMLAGGLLVNTFLTPKAASNDDTPIAQLYSLSGAGNTATPFQVIPVQYGRLKTQPVYASMPWTEYQGLDSYLNLLFDQGAGKYLLEEILIDDTLLWDNVHGLSSSFTGVEIQQCDPGVPFTLFPSNVVTSSEVNSQEITDVPLGYFVVNASGTTLTDIAFDIVFPAGVRHTDRDGDHSAWTVFITASIQEVDNAGSPIGPEIFVLNNTPISYNTPQPQRLTYKFNLTTLGQPLGRYQARMSRSPTTSTDTDHTTDLVQWVGLRGFLQGTNTYPSSSVTGIRILATAQLSQNSAKRFGFIQTRILPVWTGSAFVEQPTRNAWWAFYDAATNPQYGAEWPTNKIDFQTIVDQAAAADSRGDTFNYVFSSVVTFQQAFDLILASNRAKVCWLGDVLSATRDEWKPIPQMLLSDYQIVRGSLEVDYLLNSEDSSDSVQGQFLNEDTWQPAQLQYPPDGGSFFAQRPSSIQLDGVTNKDQMFDELRFLYKQSQLRRINVRLDTEHDGRLLRYGSIVKVQSFLPKKWGVSGEIVSYNTGTKTLKLSKDVTFDIGQYYVELRDKTGGYFGPVKVSNGTHTNEVIFDSTDLALVESDLSTTVEDALDRMDGSDPPTFVFGKSDNLSRNCIVLSGKPTDNKVSLELTVDVEAVHDGDGITVPVVPIPPNYADPRVPIITGLVARFGQGVAEPYLTATWWPAKGALYYKAQVSYDEGNTWTTIRDNLPDPSLSEVVARSNLRLRVAGIGQLQGPYSFVDVTVPDIVIGPNTVAPSSLLHGLEDYVINQLKEGSDNVTKVVQQIASVAAEHDAANFTQTTQIRSQTNNLQSRVTISEVAFTDFTTAFASYQVEVTASLGDLEASVITNSTAIATADGQLAAIFTLKLTVDGYVSGFQSTNDGVTSNFQVVASNFIVAEPGVAGGTPVPVWAIGTVGGVARIVYHGDMFGDGSINAQALNVVHLSAISADLGNVTAGTLANDATASKMLMDLNGAKFTIYDNSGP
jgi:hypothetical protein